MREWAWAASFGSIATFGSSLLIRQTSPQFQFLDFSQLTPPVFVGERLCMQQLAVIHSCLSPFCSALQFFASAESQRSFFDARFLSTCTFSVLFGIDSRTVAMEVEIREGSLMTHLPN